MQYKKKSLYKRRRWPLILAAAAAFLIVILAVAQIPAVKSRIIWRWERIDAYVRGVVNPVQAMPTPNAAAQAETPLAATPAPSVTPSPTATLPQATTAPTLEPSPTQTLTPTALPESAKLEPPPYETQDINNCGPTTLSMFLHYYNWTGDQFTISDVVKPIRQDRNVNVEELMYFTSNYVGYLRTDFRVGGTLETLKRFVAAGMPVMIEEGFLMAESYWPNDDRWSGHYLLITGYNDATQTFTVQDSYVGPNLTVAYSALEKTWQMFNHVYIFAYYPEQEDQMKAMLGDAWDADQNRQNALDAMLAATESDANNAYNWFNLGSNYVYFGKYSEAARAFDKAREIGIPQRMLRYQFGPFFAYFHTNRIDDLLALTDYALQITPNSEEALLWNAWALYRQNKREDAMNQLNLALEAHPGYADALYAQSYILNN